MRYDETEELNYPKGDNQMLQNRAEENSELDDLCGQDNLTRYERKLCRLIRAEKEGRELSESAEDYKQWICERLAQRMVNTNKSAEDFPYSCDIEAVFHETFKPIIDDLNNQLRSVNKTDALNESMSSSFLEKHANAPVKEIVRVVEEQDSADQSLTDQSEKSDHQKFQQDLKLAFLHVEKSLPPAEVTKEEWADSLELVTEIVNEQHLSYTDKVYDQNTAPLDKDFQEHRADFNYELKQQSKSPKKNLNWHEDKLKRMEKFLADNGGPQLAAAIKAVFGAEAPVWVEKHFIEYKSQGNNKAVHILYPPMIETLRGRLIQDEQIRSIVFSKMQSGRYVLMGIYKSGVENNITENAKEIAQQVAHDIKQQKQEGKASEEIIQAFQGLFWLFYYRLFIYVLANARKFRIEFSDETNQKEHDSENNQGNANALHNKVISRFSPETFSKLKNKPQIKSNDTLPGLIDEQGWRDGKELAELQKKNQILKSHLSEREWFLISYKTIGGLTLAEAADKLDISVPTFRKYRDETFEKSRKLLDQISK